MMTDLETLPLPIVAKPVSRRPKSRLYLKRVLRGAASVPANGAAELGACGGLRVAPDSSWHGDQERLDLAGAAVGEAEIGEMRSRIAGEARADHRFEHPKR